MAAIGVIWMVIEVSGLIDALRRPAPDWNYADRDRPFWVIGMLFFGPLVVLPYLFAVTPRFPNNTAREDMTPFLKR